MSAVITTPHGVTMSRGSNTSVQPKRTRASRPKVRTGCITCKIRHKKCDETQPSCLRCTTTGRKCDGYQQPSGLKTRPSAVSNVNASGNGYGAGYGCAVRRLQFMSSSGTPSLLLPSDRVSDFQAVTIYAGPKLHGALTHDRHLTERERGYLDFFRTHTSVQWSSYFHDDFWCRLVLQACEVEPAIRHAAIALGGLHRNFESQAVDEKLRDEAFPLQQCNKAIALLRNQMSSGDRPMETTLVTCILLISFAFLQGDTNMAISHLHFGTRLLKEWQAAEMLGPGTGSAIGSALTKLFSRMEFYLNTFASPEEEDAEEEPISAWESNLWGIEIPDPIESLDQAGGLLFGIIGCAMQNEQRRLAQSLEAHQFRDRVRSEVANKLCRWNAKLNTFLESNALIMTSKDTRTVMLLQLWSETLHVMNATHGRESEMRFDAFEQQFRRVVRLGEALLDPTVIGASPTGAIALPSFSVETGIIPPLFYCSYKCRNWFIRREALTLLSRWQRQEGLWHTPGAVAVLERLITVESEGLVPGATVPEHARVDSAQVKIAPNDPEVRLRYCRVSDVVTGKKHWETEWLTWWR